MSIKSIRKSLGKCTRCDLSKTRKNIVFGEGSLNAKLVIIGEAPGQQEDLSGRPFVGDSGKLLDKIVYLLGIDRSDTYICNILKCRPPGNRRPEPNEVAACKPFLIKQLKVIKPQLILALGSSAAQYLLYDFTPISKLRGKFYKFQESLVLPTFHPGYLLRNPGAKKEVWEDIKLLIKKLDEVNNGEKTNT